MLFSYKGLDKSGNTRKGYVNSSSKVEAMQQLKYDMDLMVVFYLREKVDNLYINKFRMNTDKVLEKAENYSDKKKMLRHEKRAKKSHLILSKTDLTRLNDVLHKLKLIDTKKELSPELEKKILSIFKEVDLNISNTNLYNPDEYSLKERPVIRDIKKSKEKNEELQIDWSLIETSNSNIDKRTKKLKVKDEEIILFTKRLALMLRAGLSLIKSLTIIEATVSKNLSIILSSVIEDIQQGTGFSSAIAKFPKQFDTTYVALVLIGESTGDFANCLVDIVSYKERGSKLKKKISSATLYPKMLGGVLVLVLLGGSKFFIPIFESMFVEQGLELPALTQLVFSVANVMPQLLTTLIGIVVGIMLACKANVNINRFFTFWTSKLLLKTPIINNIILTSNMYTFSSTSALMLKNGLRLNEVLKLTIGVINNIHIKNEIGAILNYVVQGMSLSEAMGEQEYFDKLLSSIVLTGEESGKLDEALYEISLYYDDILNNKINILMELVQPVSTLLIGGLAVPIILAIYLPIFDMTSGAGM